MRIHLGCGDKYWPGWVNVDEHANDVDYNAPAYDLSAIPGCAEEIQCIHLFEHIPRLQVNEVLKHWYDKLDAGGRLVMEMPSMEKISRLILDGENNLRLTLLGIFGDPRDGRPGMMHQWCWTTIELKQELDNAGFINTKFSEPLFHIPKRDMRVVTYKPDGDEYHE
jgi:hypothetical protein